MPKCKICKKGTSMGEGGISCDCGKNPLDVQVGGSHYKSMKIQPIEYLQANNFNCCESYAIKYVSRHQNKNGRADIEKAIHCLELLLTLEYGEERTDQKEYEKVLEQHESTSPIEIIGLLVNQLKGKNSEIAILERKLNIERLKHVNKVPQQGRNTI